MRQTVSLNRKWAFVMAPDGVPDAMPEPAYYVNIPHTWNAIDGQDGGGDYYRGTCAYVKKISPEDLPEGEKLYIEILGANSSADLYVGGQHVAHHDGGYSTWRADVTGLLSRSGDTLIVIMIDNSANDKVYPQMADFTFYGGLYRDVNLIGVPVSHFDLMYCGGPGIAVTPIVDGRKASVKTEVYIKNAREGQILCCTIKMPCGRTVARTEVPAAQTTWDAVIEDVHLWHGRRYPYLYTAIVELIEDGKVLDAVSTRFGCRTFAVDPQKGFILNGEEYPLRGVSRHQDRWGVGNALTHEQHREDMELIAEVGANTIRLAHYQHDPYFYDLCDEYGMVVWAEIPYISQHMPKGRENTISQMKELIAQNYNHASIAFWGISNEITMKGEQDADLIENHKVLNTLCHEMDKTRLTTMAVVSMCPMDAEYIQIPDTVCWNHYFGWYGGDTDMNGPWFDRFHALHPGIPVGCSEYGCEALNWHTSNPTQGDYTEEYQAHYHEELIKQLYTRKYLFATYVWNMFDFGSDSRAEGGENGINHKGLVTFDRKYKKDAFYAYKAWLSDEPFVYIAGKRYRDRVEDKTKITVYSNCDEVELFANGKSVAKKISQNRFFYFEVDNVGSTILLAKSGKYTDTSEIRRVDTLPESYILREKNAVLNWFDIEAPEGRFSLNDKISDIINNEKGKVWFANILKKLKISHENEKINAFNFAESDDALRMLGGFTVLRLCGMLGMMDINFTRDELLSLNRDLNEISK